MEHFLEQDRAHRPPEPGHPRRTRVYAIIGLLQLAYLAFWVFLAALFEPNLQFFSYYALDYSQGFVRRGLAGEIVNLFSDDLYFTGMLVLRWLVPALFVAALAAVAWTVAFRFGRSERRTMLALLVPLLPFGYVRAVVLPTPDLLGEAALMVFALLLVLATKSRTLLIASGAYGATTAVLTLVHEAIPFLQALGAVLAIVVLTRMSANLLRWSTLLAVAPGLAVALAIALFGRQDASSLCDRLPHKLVDFPITLSPGQILSGEHAYTDYHDWTCRFIAVTTSHTPLSGSGSVGWAPWVSSTVLGLVILTVTVFLIRVISGAPLAQLRAAIQRRVTLIVLAGLLLVPVFATSSDWARWWAAISLDVGVVYLLQACRRTESARPATRRTRLTFTVAAILLTVFPMLVGISARAMVAPLIAQCEQLATDPQWVGICP